jgi:hypothetical protein
MDLPTLGTIPNSKQDGSATQEAKDLGNLQCLGQTVRDAQANGLQGLGEQSATSRQMVRKSNRTTSTAPRNTDGLYFEFECNLCRADGPRPPGGRPQTPGKKT